jgi:hypothetical protein
MKILTRAFKSDVNLMIPKLRSANRKVGIAAFESPDSAFEFALGFSKGLIDVLPDDSFLSLCKGNAT